MSFTPEMTFVLLPEIGLFTIAVVLLAISLLKNEKVNQFLGWITAGMITLVLILTGVIAQPQPGEQLLLWGQMVRLDHAGYLFKLIFLIGAGLTALFACTDESIKPKPEFYLMLVFSTLGMCLMASAGNIIMLFLAIETASLPLYIMAGIRFRDEGSVESGIKYFLFGSMSSAVLLYGLSLIYGFSGTTNIFSISGAISEHQVPLLVLVIGSVLVLAGFAFKISAVPFHFWAPDVYEGAPTSVAGFLSTVSKAAGFAVLMRFFINIFGLSGSSFWLTMLVVISVASMFLGNLAAIPQKNLKRMIAYSSIAQAGYILIGVVSGTQFGLSGAVYYIMAYLVTNLAVFAIIAWVEKNTKSSEISAFSGLSRVSPGLALMMMIGLLSLGGIPPLAGFFAKVLVIGAAVESGQTWLAFVGIINAVIGLYYYLRVMKVMYLDEPGDSVQIPKPPLAISIGLAVCVLGILILGIIYTPWYGISQLAAGSF